MTSDAGLMAVIIMVILYLAQLSLPATYPTLDRIRTNSEEWLNVSTTSVKIMCSGNVQLGFDGCSNTVNRYRQQACFVSFAGVVALSLSDSYDDPYTNSHRKFHIFVSTSLMIFSKEMLSNTDVLSYSLLANCLACSVTIS